MPLVIAYQGEPGANSHIACREAYPQAEPLACATFEDAFSAIQEKRADLGMIPIENSLAGRVADIHHLMPEAGLHVIGEHFLPIRFHLLGLPGARLEDVRDVYSHIHALGQCRGILRKIGARGHVAGDTAGSAREVAEWGDKSRASLATPLAGEIYGLVPLAENVEDADHNTTRFVVLSREARWPERDRGRQLCTTFLFRVRNTPSALYKALGGFATNSVNMTRLESYMVDGRFVATQFLADVDGHPDDPGLSRALEELSFFSKELRILGVYPVSPFRERASFIGE